MTPEQVLRQPDMRETWGRIKALHLALADMRRQRDAIGQKMQEVNEQIRDLQLHYRTEYNRRTTEGTE